MQIQFFTISAFEYEAGQEALNKFLRGRRVLKIKKKLVEAEGGAYWCIAVKYIDGKVIKEDFKGQKERVDYKKVLDERSFEIFDCLRQCRKIVAENQALPLYAIFTNAELASMVTLPEITADNLKTIEGIGSRKLEKFGQELLTLYEANCKNEKNRKSNS